MYNPVTADLITRAPALNDLDLETLPQELTRVFAEVVSLRSSSLETITSDSLSKLKKRLERLQRLANTYEAYIVSLPSSQSTEPAAFVAASAHRLLLRAQEREIILLHCNQKLTQFGISSDIAAMLLFLIAGYPSDAEEIARLIEIPSEDKSLEAVLVRSLVSLASGALDDIKQFRYSRETEVELKTLDERATYRLWHRILTAVRELARELRGSDQYSELLFDPIEELAAIRDISTDLIETSNIGTLGRVTAYSTFPGPHHLASLLISAGQRLRRESTATIQPPSLVDTEKWSKYLSRLAKKRPYLWLNHLDALASEYLEPGNSAVISFPTGAGKSLLAELKTASTVFSGRSVVYIAPTHALAWQILNDLRRAFPSLSVADSLSGEGYYAELNDTKLPDIAVMTPERCLTLVSLYPEEFEHVGLLVFDECHLLHPRSIDDSRRGLDAMLCLLGILEASQDADVLLLSAMMSNAKEIADWISSITERPCVDLALNWKPTRQVRGCIVYESDEIAQLSQLLEHEHQSSLQKYQKTPSAKRPKSSPKPKTALLNELKANPAALFGLRQTWNTLDKEDYALCRLLDNPVQLSASDQWQLIGNKNNVAATMGARFAQLKIKSLVFIQNKDHCESAARNAARKINALQQKSIVFTPQELALRDAAIEDLGGVEHLIGPFGDCAGAHHGLLLPCERHLIESLFRRPDGIDLLFATPTLAQGMNLPAEIVILSGDSRFDKTTKKNEPMLAHELLNAAGRAGRAGLSASGMVLVIPDKLVSYNSTESRISGYWSLLQRKIFSKEDQCLEIQDPIELLLDHVQNATTEDTRLIQYFLTRIPIGVSQEMPDLATERILNRSLAAYKAKKQGNLSSYQDKVKKAIKWRQTLGTVPPERQWLSQASITSGVSLKWLEELDTALLGHPISQTMSTLDCVKWLFAWFNNNPRRFSGLLSNKCLEDIDADHRIFMQDNSNIEISTTLNEVFRKVRLWMTGRTLRDIEIASGVPSDKVKLCKKARQFVRRFIPELSYVAGLIAQMYRGRIASEGASSILPLNLATLAACIREGVDHPTKLAIRYYSGPFVSRVSCHAVHDDILAALPDFSPDASFGDVRQAVGHILKHKIDFKLARQPT